MPDKLKAHSNERIDLVDFILAANDYTSSTNAFDKERTWLDGKSRILEGFYVEISDQTLSPGQITVYNGTGLDREGRLLNDESLANSATTLTLAGASQSFYVEIELSESESSTDSRAFWDPTVSNTSPIPNGSEVTINVPTRITPNWQIVYPVSTSGFTATTNPNSNRVPIALLNTNGSNQITNAVNTYGSLVNASTKALTDTFVATGSVAVIDSKLFAVGSTFTLDFAGADPEPLTVTGNDLDNSIISFTPGLSFDHLAGSIVRQTGVTARFLPQTLDPNDPTFLAVLPTGRPNDQERRMFQGDETRGSAFLASKSTNGARNDLDIRTLKDEIDFLSAVVRDMKFGHPRVDVTSVAPPSSFSTRPRYYDAAGGITGARTAYVTVGNGTTTFGDFNGTDQNTFTAAENALPAGGGTIYVKPSTYTFTAPWILNKPNVNVVGDGRLSTVIVSNVVGNPAVAVTGGITVALTNLSINVGTGLATVVNVDAANLFATRCSITSFYAVNSASVVCDTVSCIAQNLFSVQDSVFSKCNFSSASSIIGEFTNTLFENCEFLSEITSAIAITGASSNLKISNCTFANTTTNTTLITATSPVTNIRIENSNFVGRNTGGTVSCLQLTNTVTDAVFEGNTFTGSHAAITADSAIVRISGNASAVFSSCVFAEASAGTGAIGLSLVSGSTKINIDNCSFEGCQKNGIRAFNSTVTDGFLNITNCLFSCSNWGSYNGVYLSDFSTVTTVTGCKFNAFSGLGTPTQYAVRVVSAANTSTVYVENNIFNFYITNGNARPVFISSSSINSFLGVTGNTFTTAGNAIGGTGTFRGVAVEGATCVAQRNTFRDIVATGTGSIACIYNNSNPSDVKLAVRDNTFCQMSTANGTLRAVDVLYGNTDDSVAIENNTVHDITVAVSSPTGLFRIDHATSLDTAHKLVFSGNTITNCQLGTGGGCSALRLSYGGATITSNTFSELTAPGSTTLSAISLGDSTSVTINNNNFNTFSSTGEVHGINVFSGSPALTLQGNKIAYINSSSTIAVGINVQSTLSGVVSGNTVNFITGTHAYGIKAAAMANTLVTGNYFSLSSSTLASDISVAASSTNSTISNNICVKSGAPTNANGVILDQNALDDVTITGNTFKGHDFPIYLTTTSSTAITGNILITNNDIDSSTLSLSLFVGIFVLINVTGTGITRGVSITGNTIRMATGVSVRAISFGPDGVAGGYSITGLSISDNHIVETGATLTTGRPLRILTDGVTPVNIVSVNNNRIVCTGNLGVRSPAITVEGVSKLTCNSNTVLWNTGSASSVVDINSSSYVNCVGNVVSSNTTGYGFDATTSSTSLAVGNRTELTGPPAAIVFNFTNVADNY